MKGRRRKARRLAKVRAMAGTTGAPEMLHRDATITVHNEGGRDVFGQMIRYRGQRRLDKSRAVFTWGAKNAAIE